MMEREKEAIARTVRARIRANEKRTRSGGPTRIFCRPFGPEFGNRTQYPALTDRATTCRRFAAVPSGVHWQRKDQYSASSGTDGSARHYDRSRAIISASATWSGSGHARTRGSSWTPWPATADPWCSPRPPGKHGPAHDAVRSSTLLELSYGRSIDSPPDLVIKARKSSLEMWRLRSMTLPSQKAAGNSSLK